MVYTWDDTKSKSYCKMFALNEGKGKKKTQNNPPEKNPTKNLLRVLIKTE